MDVLCQSPRSQPVYLEDIQPSKKASSRSSCVTGSWLDCDVVFIKNNIIFFPQDLPGLQSFILLNQLESFKPNLIMKAKVVSSSQVKKIEYMTYN